MRRTTFFALPLLAVSLFCSPALALSSRSAPLAPVFLESRGRTSAAVGAETTGYRHGPLDLSHLAGKRVFGRTLSRTATFPVSFDLRSLSRVTPVRDQEMAGTCWAHAALASIESNILTQGGDALSLSPQHLSWFVFKTPTAFTTEQRYFDDDPAQPYAPNQNVFQQGGWDWQAVAALARWVGPVAEAECPYGPFPDSPAEISPDRLPTGSETVLRHLQNAYYLAGPYEPLGLQQFNLPAHDAFDRTLFSPDAPADGAWIVKNSWGPDWGENGFFHLSYSDTSRMEGVAFVVGPVTSDDSVYYHDPLGWTRSWGGDGPEGWFANVFVAGNGSARKAGARENLTAVSFYTGSPNSTYEVRIYTGVASGDPVSGTLATAPVTGSIATPGYHTVALPAAVPLTNGERFSVVVRLTTPGFDYPIPIECFVEGYSEKATANPGESFIGTDGSAWTDFTAEDPTGNVCIKAFTKIASVTPTPGDKGSGGGCSAATAEGAPLALLLFVPLLLIRK